MAGRLVPILALAGFVLQAAAADAADCGADVPCQIEGGAYRIALPTQQPARGAVVFFHGYNGSAAAQMRASALVSTVNAAGFAFVAPDGVEGSWTLGGAPGARRDDAAFVDRILADLERRHGLATGRVVLSGFSLGASMAFVTTCRLGDRLAGMVTFAGVFWEPLPAAGSCRPPPPVLHVHGRADRTFPLAGRLIGGRWRQGDTLQSLTVLASSDTACHVTADLAPPAVPGMDCAQAPGCTGGRVRYCLHDGGHEIRAEWLPPLDGFVDAAAGHP